MNDKTKCYICLGVIGVLLIRNIYLMKDRDNWKGIATKLDSGDPFDPNNPNNNR